VKARTSILPFVLAELLILMAVVLPVAHSRSFGERLLLTARGAALPAIAPDEGVYILMRSLIMVLVLQISFAFRDLYRWTVIMRPQLTVMRLVEGVATVLVLLPLLHYVLGALDGNFELKGALRRLQIHPMLVLAASGAAFLAGYGLRMRWPRWMRRARLGERVLFVGGGPVVDVIEEELRRRHDPGIQPVGFLDASERAPPHRRVLGTPEELESIVEQQEVVRVVIDPAHPLNGERLNALRARQVRITDTATFYQQLTGRLSVESLADPALLLTAPQGAGLGYAVLGRLLDLVVATLGLLVALPLCLLVAILIKLDSRGPVLYRQERVGRNGRVFTLVKFRSMRVDAEAESGPVWASGADARVTRVGRWLRKLRIDEIPQLWSVILNDMSLVGPRPERPYFVQELSSRLPHYSERHLVKPGVTGWAQINHSYGNSVDDAFLKLQYDLYYVQNRSLALDVAILLRTVKVVVLQEGAV
jgi:exopolysaccharide biosynthesis polyprenyl glycosylphosphotransferase